jgi:hypothetical protein
MSLETTGNVNHILTRGTSRLKLQPKRKFSTRILVAGFEPGNTVIVCRKTRASCQGIALATPRVAQNQTPIEGLEIRIRVFQQTV